MKHPLENLFKNNRYLTEVNNVEGRNCFTGSAVRIEIRGDKLAGITETDLPEESALYVGPGLIDLQVNGINGIDFNDIKLTPHDVTVATHHLLSQGVTTFFPTIITNSDQNVERILETIRLACEHDTLVHQCIGGIHLEGPFISKAEGARGAHHEKYVKAPDWQLVCKLQEVSGGRIRLITLAPEWEGAADFIRTCRNHNILVSIGHSNAAPAQIREAVAAGAGLSTHLGNGVPAMLQRHPNILWEQLAEDQLYASIIADGFHLPDAFMKVVMKTKGDKTILVSDATCFSGMEPGTYKSHIGQEVILQKDGKLAIKKTPDLLAGATKSLLEDIQYLVDRKLVALDMAWQMASLHPARFLGNTRYGIAAGQPADLVIFDAETSIRIRQVIKNGEVVYEQ